MGIGSKPHMLTVGDVFDDKAASIPLQDDECKTTTDATRILLSALPPTLSLVAIGHRVVHGGDMVGPMLVSPDIIEQLQLLAPLAPLHQPYNLEAINLIAEMHPDLPQVVCFDTSFHNTLPALNRRFAIPRHWHDRGVRRYGFHGISYEYITKRLAELSPRALNGRTLAAHLGSGASLCAIKGGKSLDMTTGFSALDGLVMGTRPGTLDAGVILYFLQETGLDVSVVNHMLYHESGLLGVSGISSDIQTLLSSQDPAAREAIDLFCLRITRESGGLISLMGGLDAVVFTGGIGEHAASIRAQICASLEWIGIQIDKEKNAAFKGNQEILLSSPQSKAEVWVIPTNEEAIICAHTRTVADIL